MMLRRPSLAFTLTLLVTGVALAGEPPRESDAISRALDTVVSVDFEETPVQEVLEYLHAVSGLPLLLDPEVDEPEVNLTLNNVSVSTVLGILTHVLDLAWMRERGVVFISYREKIQARRAVVQCHDVRDLIIAVEDFPGPPGFWFDGMDGWEDMFDPEDEPMVLFDPDVLIELVVQRVGYDTWDSLGFAISFMGGQLVISHVPEVHEQVAALLEELRELGTLQVTVDAWVGALPADRLQEHLAPDAASPDEPAFITPGQARTLRQEARTLEHLSLVGFNGQRISAHGLQQQARVTDYEVEIAQSAVAYDPVVRYLRQGAVLDVRPMLGLDRRTATLDLRLDLARPGDRMREVPTSLLEASVVRGTGDLASTAVARVGQAGSMQHDQLSIAQIRTMVQVPLGMGALFVRTAPLVENGELLVVIVTPHLGG
jgi:hypothetical protein